MTSYHSSSVRPPSPFLSYLANVAWNTSNSNSPLFSTIIIIIQSLFCCFMCTTYIQRCKLKNVVYTWKYLILSFGQKLASMVFYALEVPGAELEGTRFKDPLSVQFWCECDNKPLAPSTAGQPSASSAGAQTSLHSFWDRCRVVCGRNTTEGTNECSFLPFLVKLWSFHATETEQNAPLVAC